MLGATGAENLPRGRRGQDEPRAGPAEHRAKHQHRVERVPQCRAGK